MTPGVPRSRELTEAAAPGGGLAAATVLALALAWANVAPPNAMADFELPFLVRACPHLHITNAGVAMVCLSRVWLGVAQYCGLLYLISGLLATLCEHLCKRSHLCARR